MCVQTPWNEDWPFHATGEVAPGPSDEAEEEGIYHWGDGSSEGEIELDPGEYDLCLHIADGTHRVFGDTNEIPITVDED